jgi:hypothetical protein
MRELETNLCTKEVPLTTSGEDGQQGPLAAENI